MLEVSQEKDTLLLLLALGLGSLLSLLGLGALGEERSVDGGGDNTTVSNGGLAKELAELLIVADSELDVAGVDTSALVVTSSVTSEFEDFSGEVLEDSSEVDGGRSTNTLSILATLEEATNTTNGEGETSTGRARGHLARARLCLTTATLTLTLTSRCGSGH